MRGVDYPVYDFLAASRMGRPLTAALKVWLDKFVLLFQERWSELVPTAIGVSPRLMHAMPFDDAQARWKRPSIGAPISIQNGAVPGMFVVRRAEMIVLVMEVLRESLKAPPVDRELTSIEQAMSQLIFEHLASVFGEAWPDKEKMSLLVGQLDSQPSHSRMFHPKKEVVVTGVEIRTADASEIGAVAFDWVFGKDELMRLLGVKEAGPIADDGQRLSPQIVRQLSVELSAILGNADLSMRDLQTLTAGDIVLLNQPIDQPILLEVNKRPLFRAWPGRSGERQCVMVETTMS